MNYTRHIPNLFTLTNLLSGCILVYITVQMPEKAEWVNFEKLFLIFVSVSLFCDLMDGLVARALRVSSPLGLQLDSLADMVTFGVFPGMLMVRMLENTMETQNFTVAIVGFLITLFSALRLAKFNIDLTQVNYFKGLATPANSLLILGIFFLFNAYPQFFKENGLNLLLAVTVISSFLLISDIPLFSFKLKKFEIPKLLPQLILLISAVVLIVIFGMKALAPIIILYILISIIFRKSFVHA